MLGLGARPNVGLAISGGLATADGILADELLETPAAGIFVAGDVAAAWHPRYGRNLRVEHWDAARRQGRVVAANFLGRRVVYDRVPYFYSDQFEIGMESWGLPTPEGHTVIRDLPATNGFIVLWLEGGRPVAALQANAWDAAADVRRLVDQRPQVDLRAFGDPSVPINEVGLSAAA